ncbi:hypothetical protein ACK8P5_25580 (plasmid) [Paenibacillus sp. EC2-1]|uniref:hypothetical protein n=1 Tax=Paenibacillus sp. EC2-1 TaxID=3388665 RepID=UPI003BEF13BF
MAYYSGKVASKNLYSTLIGHIAAVQPGESLAWWKKESSLDSDGVYTSTGSSGSERIVLVFRENTIGSSITVGTAKDYTPGVINTAGAFDQLRVQNMVYYTSAQADSVEVSYDINITKDRIIIHLQGDKLIAAWQNPVLYIGMPIKYDVNDRRCVVLAISENPVSHAGGLYVLQDANNVPNPVYTWHHVNSPGNPSWGNSAFLEVLHFGYGLEGLRGEFEGLYVTNPLNMVDGTEVDVTGTRFKTIVSKGAGNFPRATFLLKMS